MADQLGDGTRFRTLPVLDLFTRECLAIAVGKRLSATDVVTSLTAIRRERGTRARLLCDNGSEFTSQALDLWAYHHGVALEFSRPGKPTDNAFIESFNGTFRDECLNAHWFESLQDARMQIETWRQEYNESRPHRTHGEIPPAEFARRFSVSTQPRVEKGADD